MRIEKGPVVLRDFTVDDVPLKVKWINDPNNNEFLHYDIPLCIEKTKEWFANKDNSRRYDCVIEYNGVPVGLIGLLSLDKKNSKAEYYISIGEDDYKKKGIATCATRMILHFAFFELHLHKVYLNVDEQNDAACRLYEKTGFICEGFFSDDLVKEGVFINRKRYAIFDTMVLI
ncbi:MAG: GNAT family N-acetyltransferase [Parasporobacterium sp.]|nr:GNAT family N-acetyltransferase [Parasporobacterium sp.]